MLEYFDETWRKSRFQHCGKRGVVYFLIVPSVGTLCLVTETQKRAPTELGSTQRAQTLSVGIFFAARKIGMVYSFMAPSVGVLCLVTKTQKWAPTKLGSTQRAQTLSVVKFFAASKYGMVYFFMVPSVEVLCFVTETQKRVTITIVQYFKKVTFQHCQPELPRPPSLAHREAEELGG